MNAPKKARILHVDDDPGVQSLVRATLVQLGGFEVETAGDGFSALRIAAERAPDLILLDVGLPTISGVDTLHAMREIEALRRVPVVFLTASADLMQHIELLTLGAETVLQKPFRPHQLVRTLERALGPQKEV